VVFYIELPTNVVLNSANCAAVPIKIYKSFFNAGDDHRPLHSFPTRRSSDLPGARARSAARRPRWPGRPPAGRRPRPRPATAARRSEEHTSELQSREKLVWRLLREKKKQTHCLHERSRKSRILFVR